MAVGNSKKRKTILKRSAVPSRRWGKIAYTMFKCCKKTEKGLHSILLKIGRANDTGGELKQRLWMA